jgi:predicted nucleotidyltransferase
MPEPLQLRELLARLTEAEIEFVLVGGLAVNAWGYLRATRDIDLVPEPSSANLEKLDTMLRHVGGKVDIGGQLLDENAIKTFLRAGDRTLVATDFGEVDVLQGLPQIPSFAVLDAEAKSVDVDGLIVRVCSLEHLREMKRSSERPRDREDLVALEAAQSDDDPEG